jgi:type II secretory pathway pseudopilin PulG
MKKHFCRETNRSRGFTLVEILVAEAIFLVLLFVVIQLIFGVIQTAEAQKKRMDALGDERQSLDRLSLDWAGRVRRSDVTGIFTKQSGNDQISFLTQVQAYSGARHLAWVTYQVNTVSQVIKGSQTSSTSALMRGILGYNWASSDTTGAANPLMTFPLATPTLAASNYEPLANTVFRLEFCFLQQVPAGSVTTPFTVNNALNLNSPTLVGVVVTVAALDQQSRQILTQSQLTSLASALPRVTTDGQNPQSVWLTAINGSGFATAAGVPQTVASAVRVFQRILYIKE